MSEVKLEIQSDVLLDKCNCCLGDGLLKDLWREYCEDGKTEIYGEMLNECFDLTNCIQFSTESEKICESCICRLRDALEFKQEILACGQLRFECLNTGLEFPKKEVDQFVEEGECFEEIDGISDDDPDSGCNKEPVFEDVEYLEVDEEDATEVIATNSISSQFTSENTREISSEDRNSIDQDAETWKKPQRKKKDEKIYKKYIREDMIKAMATVQSGLLTSREAAKEFNVPRQTLNTRLMENEAKDNTKIRNKIRKKEEHYQFIEEVKKILTYTNAIPFKTKATRYFCTYCSTDGPCFEDPDELRAHTRTEHVDDKTRNIEMVLRPQYLNEVIKMDIDALHCTVCCTIIPTWNKMFQHLEESHNIDLDQAYTKVIPYVLKRDLKCALCSASFPNYHHLDSHMNSHYASYVCSECGDTFLSASRLTKHTKVHKTGRFPCEACGKVFAQYRYKQKHYDHVHKQELNIKCVYCPEKFHGTFQRHLHIVEKHQEKVRIMTCELCGKKFEWKRYYVAHMRRTHNIRTI